MAASSFDIEALKKALEPAPEQRALRPHLEGTLELPETLRRALESEVWGWLQAMPPAAEQSATYLLEAGGKRLRPLLAMLSCGAAGGEPTAALPVATAVELLHSGTLLHDDVVDDSERRRGQPAARLVWGNAVAVLSGDFCFFAALDALVARQELGLVSRALQVARSLAQGELEQLERRGDPMRADFAAYWRGIELKTASLMAFSTWGGAWCAGAGEDGLDVLERYGVALGRAFQVVDDVLDLQGEPEQTGKTLGQDLADGTFTLPVLYAMETSESLAARLRAAAQQSEVPASELDALIRAVQNSDGVQKAREDAQRLTHEASSILMQLPSSAYRGILETLTRSLLNRVS